VSNKNHKAVAARKQAQSQLKAKERRTIVIIITV